MLNISNNRLHKKVGLSSYASGKHVLDKSYYKVFNRFLLIFAIVGLVILFLPWTQNITGNGQVTTLKPSQRPQTLQSPIPGRIEKWYVQEGDFVKAGDTILKISEVKSDYFDPNLLSRTQEQINANEGSVLAYGNKQQALSNQIEALEKELLLKRSQLDNKILQAKLKVSNDSVKLIAAEISLDIARRQFNRVQSLEASGLKATREVEDKRLKLQETDAKYVAQLNDFERTKNMALNASLERLEIETSYQDKISKAQSDLYTARSNFYNASEKGSKLSNTFANYSRRNELLYMLAPQDGYINKAIKGGIGETFKEGEKLIGIMPANYELAVETFVRPIDLPLVHIGEKVRVQFDGWPVIVFSGWPNVSYGTYGAKVVAIETFISENGKYRILLAPDTTDHEWPTAIRIGSGARTIALLEDVPIWFELWRQLNGFPPNYYVPEVKNTQKMTSY
ncbi:MAG: HlyD family secretion protein [Flavobacteriia bacterium]|nr:HlyD family secretion protein [Flavobacteriia bacterium]